MRGSNVLAVTLAISTVATASAQAIQLADGTVYFAYPPQLISATSTFKEAYSPFATYYFTLNVPANAGEPLQRVTINQKEGTVAVRFNLKDTKAFVGTAGDTRQRLSLVGATREKKTQTISITFNPPVPPGEIVTISLSPHRNPLDGVYLFGVTAFPAGAKPHGQFLGFGRLQFYGTGELPFSPFGFP
jgi:hypothetical protein